MNETSKNLFEKVMTLQWLVRRMHPKQGKGGMMDPGRGQGRIIALLKMQPEMSQRDLSYLLDMRPQSLSELLNKLEKNSYITKTQSEADKRVMMIQLTELGKSVEQETHHFEMKEVFSSLTEEEQQTMSGYLDRIIADIEKKTGTEGSVEEFARRRAEFKNMMMNMSDEEREDFFRQKSGHGMPPFMRGKHKAFKEKMMRMTDEEREAFFEKNGEMPPFMRGPRGRRKNK